MIWRKNVSLLEYLDFCVFVKSTNFKICDVIIGIVYNGSYTYAYFFWVLSIINIIFRQTLVCYVTNISSIFWAECWRWKLVSGCFMVLLKWQCSEIWPFFWVTFAIITCPLFTFSKKWNIGILAWLFVE